jgi:DNA-binding transcriptional regulator YhcF (GntR family)
MAGRRVNATGFIKGASAMPLYKYIAVHLEYAITTGRIAPGASMPSLREAQGQWGVSLDTIRQAYRELERMGLVSIRDRSKATVVLQPGSLAPSNVHQLVIQTLQEAKQRFGATGGEVLQEIERVLQSDRPRVVVAECSATMCAMLSRQITDRWDVVPLHHVLGSKPVPDGPLVSTLYHYQQIIDDAGPRRSDFAFVHTRIATATRDRLSECVREKQFASIIVCSVEPGITVVTTELKSAFGGRVEFTTESSPVINRLVASSNPRALKLVSPRAWDHLADEYKRRSDVLLLEYDVLKSDLAKLGKLLGWTERLR